MASWIKKNANIHTACGLISLATAILPLTISEKLFESPLLGGINPVLWVSSAGIGCFSVLNTKEYIKIARITAIKRALTAA